GTGQDQSTTSAHIESITAEPGKTGTIVTIKGDHPLSYTSYDPDAMTLVLELPDADASSVQAVIPVGSAQPGQIPVSQVESHHGPSHARIELVGRTSADTRIEPDGSSIVITLEGVLTASSTPAPAAMDAAATPAAATGMYGAGETASETTGPQTPAASTP